MLVLTRREGENICINDDIIIHILDINGKQVKIGITAPKSVKVHREEVYQRIKSGKIPAYKED